MRNDFLVQLDSQRVLVTISARDAPTGPNWLDLNQRMLQFELRPFNFEEAYEYLRRRREGIRRKDAIRIYRETAGLPLGLAIWADLQSTVSTTVRAPLRHEEIRVNVLTQVVSRLLNRVSDQELVRAIYCCAVARVLREDLLGYLLRREDVHSVFRHLQQLTSLFKIVPEGLVMHDEVRYYILQDLAFRRPLNFDFATLNERASLYYAHRVQQLANNKYDEEWQKASLELLYHMFNANKSKGMGKLSEMFFDALKHYQINFCKSILELAANQSLDELQQLWLKFYEARLANSVGDTNKAVDILETIAPKISSDLLRAFVHDALAAVYFEQGLYDKVIEENRKALQITRNLSHPLMVENLGGIGWGYMEQGKLVEAKKYFSKGLKAARSFGDKLLEGWHKYNLAVAFYRSKDVEKAEVKCRQALQIFECLGALLYIAMAIHLLGSILLKRGNYEKALEYYERAMRLQRKLGRIDKVALILANKGLAFEKKAEYDQAIECYSQGLKIAQRLCQDRLILTNQYRLLRALYWAGYREKAKSLLEPTETLAKQLQYRAGLAWVNLVKGFLLMDAENLDEALEALHNALNHALNYNSYFLDEILDAIKFQCNQAGLRVNQLLMQLVVLWNNKGPDGVTFSEKEEVIRKRERPKNKRGKLVVEVLEELYKPTP